MRRILVAVDDTEASRRAAEFVDRFFGQDDVELIGLHVGGVGAATAPPGIVPPLAVGAWTYPVAGGPLYPRGMGDDQQALEQDAENVIRAASPHVDRTRVEYGDPVEEIRHVAEQEHVDLIVVGSGHKGAFDRLLTGSVSVDLAKNAPCPVLVVP